MTYGVQITNPSGLLVLSEELPTPYLVSKQAPYEIIYKDGVYAASLFNYTLPDMSSSFIAMTLPDIGVDVRYSAPTFDLGNNGVYFLTVMAFHPAGVTPGTPELYIFRYGIVPASSESYGLRLYSASEQIVFDSGRKHFMPIKVFTRPAEGGTLSLTSMPAKPAFVLPTLMRDTRVYFDRQVGQSEWERETGLEVWYDTATYLRRGAGVRFDLWNYNFQTWYGAPDEPCNVIWGTMNNAAIPMIDASLYD